MQLSSHQFKIEPVTAYFLCWSVNSEKTTGFLVIFWISHGVNASPKFGLKHQKARVYELLMSLCIVGMWLPRVDLNHHFQVQRLATYQLVDSVKVRV